MPARQQSGITLIELMMVLVLMAVLMLVGVPGFQQVIAQNRAASTANDLLYHLQLARSEALRHARVVTLCPVTEAEPEECAAVDDWAGGWILFVDANGNGDYDVGDDTLLRSAPPLPGQVTLEGPVFMSYQAAGSGSAATFALEAGSEQRWVCVELSGRAAVSQEICS
ncbi:GspH/FimT family pseudopilin [Nitrincola alkalilacustris]|uniref:GspH/FimT family pseudopilin n=1 Tax=Nitrincola alkalilacustris TaxID=1571224 RepID=UPI001456DC5F|nr:GspH/FimT family pseudopilin [Nitrincola alkalilacustris]